MRVRSIRSRGSKRGKRIALIDLDITSLLDILVIMLVFLLKSYNATGIVLNIPKGIELPTSVSQEINTSGVIVQVSTTTIWVDSKVVYEAKEGKFVTSIKGIRINALYNELVKKKEIVKQIQKQSENASPFSGRVNLVIDKTLKYSFIKKLMFTAADAGFQQYKFIVLGENE
jgi:biopolymer transport protein ExbD